MKQKIKEMWLKTKEKGFILKLSLIPFACGLMYAIAGSDNTPKQIRRFGIPVLLTLVAWFTLKNIWVLTMLSQIGVYSLGHGIPDDRYPPTGDSGSDVGRFWTLLFRKYTTICKAHRIADYFTRGTKALLIAVSCLVIPILKGNWMIYIALSVAMVGLIASIAWRGFGEKVIKIANKTYTILYVDIIVGTAIGLFVLLILKF